MGAIAVEEVPQRPDAFVRDCGGRAGAAAAVWDAVVADQDLVEKPKPENAPSNLAITGRYVLPPAIFDCLARTKPGAGGEIQLTDAMRILAQERGLVGVHL